MMYLIKCKNSALKYKLEKFYLGIEVVLEHAFKLEKVGIFCLGKIFLFH